MNVSILIKFDNKEIVCFFFVNEGPRVPPFVSCPPPFFFFLGRSRVSDIPPKHFNF